MRLGTVRTSSTLRSACSSFRIHNPLCRTLPIRPPPPRLPHLSDRASVAPSGRPPAIIASRKAPYSPNRRTAVLRRGASGTRPAFNRPTDRRTDRNTSCAIPFVRANVPPTIFPHGMLQSKNLASRRPAAADMAHIESTTIPMNNRPNTARSHADPFTNRSALRPPRRWPPA